MEMAGGKKKMLATVVGCNYAGTDNELQGCINDARAVRAVLLDRFGFAPGDVTMLTDDHDSGAGVLPTGANIKRTLAEMVARAAPGDVLFFFFAGHGTLTPPIDGHGDRDDQVVDYNLIYDMDFRQVVDFVPRGATFTMASDSCFSGGLIDQEKEQIGPNVPAHSSNRRHAVHAGRFLPYAAVLGHLSAASAHHLLVLFGADASAKYRRNHSSGARTDDDADADADAGILLSGCQADEASMEVRPDDGRAAYGAFTGALQAVLAANPKPMSNREVVCGARDVLGKPGSRQHPCLYCSDANVDVLFLGQQETKRATKQGGGGSRQHAHALIISSK